MRMAGGVMLALLSAASQAEGTLDLSIDSRLVASDGESCHYRRARQVADW